MIAYPYHVGGGTELDIEEAQELLYEDGYRDLSPEGYLDAMTRLRAQGRKLPNPSLRAQARNLAKRVETAVKPTIDFTRSQIPWHESSLGTAHRVALLPDNPHFRRDVNAVRRVLAIPAGQVRSSPEDSVWSKLTESEGLILEGDFLSRTADKVLARRWMSQHQNAFDDRGPDQFADGLTEAALASAQESAAEDLSAITDPDWLQTIPARHTSCPWHEGLPLHHAAARLLERHRLPEHLCYWVMIYILTAREEDICDLNATKVSVIHGPGEVRVAQPEHAVAVVVEGIDEFTTREDWDRIWRDPIKPQQELFWEKRGQRPQGRRGLGLERLKQALLLYEAWIDTEGAGNRSVEAALKNLQNKGTIWDNADMETARRAIKDLDDLLRPG